MQRGLHFTEGWEATGGLQALELNNSFAFSKDHSVQRPWQFLTGEEPAWGEGQAPTSGGACALTRGLWQEKEA